MVESYLATYDYRAFSDRSESGGMLASALVL
jgi:hypothetical protein